MRIVITGISKGLGHALCHELVHLGHDVAGCARSTAAIDDLSHRLASGTLFSALDIRDNAATEAWAQGLLDDWGVPDLLINNASMINDNAPLWQVPTREFDNLLATNVTAVFSTIRAFVPAMIERGSGVVVNMSSGWGRSVSASVATYCTSKWAIEGMTLALAEDLPKGLAAVTLNPGSIDTDMSRSALGDAAQHAEKPDRWAKRAAPFLLSLGKKDNGRQLSVS